MFSTRLSFADTTNALSKALGISQRRVSQRQVSPVQTRGSRKRLDGTDQQLSYGTALIALAKTAPSDVSIAEFSQRISSELKTGVAGNASTLLKGFPDAYSTAAKNAVVAASQSKLANPPSPGAFPWDSAVWDTAIWY